jgi:3-hydroxy-9,10-secoandrosta-1,3,5(10)-triene-9,17-dione monooxygenase reductase component
VEQEILGRALGRIPSGLFIVTVRAGARATAFLGSWVQQASFDPPTLVVAVKAGRFAQELLDAGAAFAVNIVPAASGPLLKHFGKGFGPEQDPYAGIAHTKGSTGVEVLPDALATLECRTAGRFLAGDHVLFLGQIVDAHMSAATGDPAVHLRKSGLHY